MKIISMRSTMRDTAFYSRNDKKPFPCENLKGILSHAHSMIQSNKYALSLRGLWKVDHPGRSTERKMEGKMIIFLKAVWLQKSVWLVFAWRQKWDEGKHCIVFSFIFPSVRKLERLILDEFQSGTSTTVKWANPRGLSGKQWCPVWFAL